MIRIIVPLLVTLGTCFFHSGCADDDQSNSTLCKETDCGQNANCIDDGDEAECVCDNGFVNIAFPGEPLSCAVDIDNPLALENPRVRGLDIVGVEIYQSIRIPLMENGVAAPEGDIPLIAGRDALLRVFVEPQSEWAPRDIFAVATLEQSGGVVEHVAGTASIFSASVLHSLVSTVNVNIPGSRIKQGAALSVELREISQDTQSGSDDSASWPKSGKAGLYVEAARGTLEIVIVPIRYDAVSPPLTPDLSPEQLALYEDMFQATYPITDVNIEIADVMPYASPVGANSYDEWQALLTAVTNLRNASSVPSSVYYYGLVSPTDHISEYCQNSCMSGLSHLGEHPEDGWEKVSVGVGFPGYASAETMIHEIAHAHGRLHSPGGGSNPGDVDPNYPNNTGLIEDWGLHLENTVLYNPADAYDFMSYEAYLWVSAYTYNALLDWSNAVNVQAKILRSESSVELEWVSIGVIEGEVAQRGPTLNLSRPPVGTPTLVHLLDGNGTIVDSTTGVYHRYGHLNGGLVLFPRPQDTAVVYAQVDGFEIVAL